MQPEAEVECETLIAVRVITHLAGTVGTSTTDTGDTSDCATGTPRFSTGLVASLFADGIGLPFVFGQALWEESQQEKQMPVVSYSLWT